MNVTKTVFPAGEITRRMNEKDFEFLRTNNLQEAYRHYEVGPNTKDPVTGKCPLSAGAYSNEQNIVYTFNDLNELMRSFKRGTILSHKLRAETGRIDDRGLFAKVLHTVKSRTKEKEPLVFAYDRLVTVLIDGQKYVIRAVGRHREEKTNKTTLYVPESITNDIRTNLEKTAELIAFYKKTIFDYQMLICSTEDGLWSFSNIACYPNGYIYLPDYDDKKDCFVLDSGKRPYFPMYSDDLSIMGEKLDAESVFIQTIKKAPLIRREADDDFPENYGTWNDLSKKRKKIK